MNGRLRPGAVARREDAVLREEAALRIAIEARKEPDPVVELRCGKTFGRMRGQLRAHQMQVRCDAHCFTGEGHRSVRINRHEALCLPLRVHL